MGPFPEKIRCWCDLSTTPLALFAHVLTHALLTHAEFCDAYLGAGPRRILCCRGSTKDGAPLLPLSSPLFGRMFGRLLGHVSATFSITFGGQI